MKTSLNLLLWTTRATTGDLRHVELLRTHGYTGVEVPIHQPDEAHHAAIGRAIRDLGMSCTASTALPGAHADFLSSDESVREAAAGYLKSVVDSAAALGAELVMGPLYQALGVFSGTAPTDGEFQRAADGLRGVADHAADAGIRLMIEPLNRFECHLVNTIAAGARLVAEIGRPNVGVAYDTFHGNIEEKDPLAEIDRFHPVIGHVHISENDRGAPGSGHLPLDETIRRFLGHGYDGWFVVESFGTALPDLAAATRCWRPTFAAEREVVEGGARLFSSFPG
jgi:D-psicose/D-tagatose/L-ribulose 3-epimerase